MKTLQINECNARKLYSTQRNFKISLDMSEAQALVEMFRLLYYFEFDTYTETTMNLIIASINQQTI